MPPQTVHEFRPLRVRSAVPSPRPPLVSGNVISISESPAFSPAVSPEPVRDGLACARGIRAAFILEGGLGLLIYAIWHIYHLAR